MGWAWKRLKLWGRYFLEEVIPLKCWQTSSELIVLANTSPYLGIHMRWAMWIEGKSDSVHATCVWRLTTRFRWWDQMCGPRPLTIEAQLKPELLMNVLTTTILSPANASPIIVLLQTCNWVWYYMTRWKINAKGEGMAFAASKEVHRAVWLATDRLNCTLK